ncbi:hypothetical protein [Geothermobacter hydrogeniphilus]|uniref:Conjugal transfer pilus assembly protein TraW n=1 Tax=Geothermobacter hydrogeniphilus TaxID=1969733 RepID=A0A1X0XX77_9BACT|nr:hypothetical protein [Geothermobacter hydrogeniphilus]ORJ57500.1 hypothetical protein B5V00_13705 [Geothermobacter hydrogeniphilus]
MTRLRIAVLFILLLVQPGQARVLGTFGKTYPIIERDALEEIRERAARVNWQSALDRIRPEEFRPEGLPRLPRAAEDRAFLVDMTYTLGFDIPDGKGGILYPKGYRFNPLDYLPFNQTLVVVDGDDPLQLDWLRGSGLLDKGGTVLLLAGGSFVELARDLDRPVFYLTPQIRERFHLRAVPAVIRRREKMMAVREIRVETKEGAE